MPPATLGTGVTRLGGVLLGALLLAGCDSRPPRPIAPEPQPPQPVVGTPAVRWPVGSTVWAVESVQSSRFSGDVVMLYEGQVVQAGAGEVLVRLGSRHRYRYRPNAPDGVNPTDWFCTPEVRHCHAAVGFRDWGGQHEAGARVSFPESAVALAEIGIVDVAQAALARARSE